MVGERLASTRDSCSKGAMPSSSPPLHSQPFILVSAPTPTSCAQVQVTPQWRPFYLKNVLVHRLGVRLPSMHVFPGSIPRTL